MKLSVVVGLAPVCLFCFAVFLVHVCDVCGVLHLDVLGLSLAF